MGSRSFTLLMSALSLEREVGVRTRRRLPLWNRHRCLSGWSVLQPRYGCGGGGRSPCDIPSRRGEVDPPSLSEAMWNSSVESPIMARNGDGGPLRVEPMMAVSESSLLGERLIPLKQSMMNSRLPKQMISPREKPLYDRRSPSEVTVSADDETIGTSREKVHCKSPYLACELSVFSTLTRTGWSRLRVPVLWSSCKLQST
jgi:hypothetical protein